MGTRYERADGLIDNIEIKQGDSLTLNVPNIYSAIIIGTQLDINLRQKAGNELDFVVFTELSDFTEVEI